MNSGAVKTEWNRDAIEKAKGLCQSFVACNPSKRYIMGRNPYAKAVASQLDVAAFIDDFTNEKKYLERPIVSLDSVPADAIVLAASGGRPLTVRKMLDGRGLTNVDYFAFYRWSGLNLPEAVFNEHFAQDFDAARPSIDRLFASLADDESKRTLLKLLSFRYTYDLSCLEGFSERQALQYFEPFFDIAPNNSVFVDVGGFDGFTSEEFIRHAPDYHAVFIFEPEARNRENCENRLSAFDRINILPYGAGSKEAHLRFSSDGSASSLRDDGDIEIHVQRIDDVVTKVPTFIKMDIEGAELMAIDGARETIAKHRPVLAIAVYHRPSDIWKIPEKVLNIYSGYRVFIRHYTESIYETVMYFVPPEYEKL